MVSKGLTGVAKTVIPGRCDASNPESGAASPSHPRKAVIASEAKQSIGPQVRRMGGAKRYPSCRYARRWVSLRSTHPTQTHLRIPAARSPGLCKIVSPKKEEGAGNAGCLLHPRSRVQKCASKTHTSIQVQTEHSGIPCAMVLQLIPRSPRRRIRLVTVIGELTALRARLGSQHLRRLDTSNGCQDHTALLYVAIAVRLPRRRSLTS